MPPRLVLVLVALVLSAALLADPGPLPSAPPRVVAPPAHGLPLGYGATVPITDAVEAAAAPNPPPVVPEPEPAPAPEPSEQDRIRGLQASLAAQGCDPGPLDGVYGPRTQRAERCSRGEPEPTPTTRAAAPVASGASLAPCGGAYPPCWVAQRESGGNYGAFNPTGCAVGGRSGCYGKWQFGWFWGGKLGLPADLSLATPEQQDEAARLLWNNGAGCSNWAAC